MHGFYNRMLHVDLSSRSFTITNVPGALLARTLGGKGLATEILLRENPSGVDPLSAENRLIFATGPVCNGPVWGGSRYGVYTKSPLTGLYCESYAGGRVPEAMDRAGFDAVVISGQASQPLVLSISPQGCLFHAADDLWGMDTYAAEDAAVERFAQKGDGYGRPGAVVIGPAGENLVRFALIENDYWRSAGRAGTGAVMGSKRLKGIVFSGDRKREVADPKGLKEYAREFLRKGKDTPGVKAYKGYGTTMMVALMNTAGAFPSRYWQQGSCDHWERISGETFHAEHDVTPHACAKCFMACGRMATITSGRHKGLKIEGPEYETIYAFGGLCMIDDMAEIASLNDLCDRLGLDTITAGNLCGLAIEAGLQGRIEPVVTYNDPDGCARLIRDIAARIGIGAVLAEGIRYAAREWAMEDQAVHVKGMEPAGYDPRVLKGMGLTYAITARGACHLRTTFYKPELSGMIPPDQVQGKAEMVIDFEDRLCIFDTLILCRFYRDLYPWEELQNMIRLVTGLELDRDALTTMANRIVTMTREFNLREGLAPDMDRLPGRLTRDALPSGHCLTEQEMEIMTREYFRGRGWDEKGHPKN
ncbi:MAG: aldehyde ferredoxin oxidoreductase family protein [Desulfovibrionales bacterium]